MRKIYFILMMCAIVATSFSQRIVRDSLLISYTLPQLDAMYSSQGIPSSILKLKYGIKVYKVIYNTLTYDSLPTVASGLMIFPDTQTYCKMPILSYQHGTTVRKLDVPSRLEGQEKLVVFAMASSGLACAMPDYHGMGDGPGYHPYQNARTEAFSVIDIVRAVKEKAPQLGYTIGEKLFLTGYSQGGHATMAAHRMIQEKLSSEMTVTAAAPMSGAYDMSGIQADLMLEEKPYSDPYYLPYLIFGNNPIYHFFNSPSEVLRVPFDTALPPVMDGIAGAGQINARMNDTVKRIFRQDQIDSFVANPNHFFRNFLRDNDVYEWVPQTPVRLYYCTLDEKVPYQNSIKAYNYFKANGAPDVDTVNGGPIMHTDCALQALLSAKIWLEQFLDTPIRILPDVTPQVNSTPGGIKLNVSGGKSPYVINWSSGSQSDSLGNLSSGTYYFTVTDANGCLVTDSVVVPFSNSIDDNSIVSHIHDLNAGNIIALPVPASGLVYFSAHKKIEITKVEVYNLLGERQNVKYDEYNKSVDISELSTGVYIAQVTVGSSMVQKKIVKK